MATVNDIRVGLARRLATITGLRAHGTWPDTVNTPAAIVKPMTRDFHVTMGDPSGAPVQFEIVVVGAPLQNGIERGQAVLDRYIDESDGGSIRAAIEADKTLGGLVTTTTVVRWRDYGSLDVNRIEYAGLVFDVEVWP